MCPWGDPACLPPCLTRVSLTPFAMFNTLPPMTSERDSPIKPSEIAQRNVDFDSLAAEDLEYNYDERGLAELRKRMCYAIAGYQGERLYGAGGGCGRSCMGQAV